MLGLGGAAGAFLLFKGQPTRPPAAAAPAAVTLKLPPAPAVPAPATEPPPLPQPAPQASLPAAPQASLPPAPQAAPQTSLPPAPQVAPQGAPQGATEAKKLETPPPPPVPARPTPRPAAAPPAPAEPATPAPAPVAAAKLGEVKLALFDPALAEKAKDGTLPAIGRDGRQPWRYYARPFDLADKRPRVAVVITNMGLSVATTDHAINALPPGVTLAFAPFVDGLKDAVQRARAKGHEVLLNAPMEPESYPRSDPGPKALLTSLSEAENLERLTWILTRGEAYVGIANLTGGRFAQSPEHLKPVLQTLKQRGLLYLDRWSGGAQSATGTLARELELPFASVQVVLDQEPTKNGIDGRLAELERHARRDGRAVGLALPYPLSLERIAVWLGGLDPAGMILAPVSAVVANAR